MKGTAAVFLCLVAPLAAQFSGFSRQDLVKYTPLNPYDRLPDGRPNAPESLWKRLKTSSSEEIWGAFWRNQYRSQFVPGWVQTHDDRVLVGRVFTVHYMPVRPEIAMLVEPDVRNYGKISNSNQRVIDMLQPGDVLVVDLFGKIDGGTFVGDNLSRAIWLATGNGFIVNGSVRDRQGLDRIGEPIYCRGWSPTVYEDVMITGINVPVRLGDVTVMPGDIAFGDRTGVTFIPPHLLQKVVEFADSQQLKDEWTREKMESHKYKSRDVYPMPATPELKKDYEGWLKQHKAQ